MTKTKISLLLIDDKPMYGGNLRKFLPETKKPIDYRIKLFAVRKIISF